MSSYRLNKDLSPAMPSSNNNNNKHQQQQESEITSEHKPQIQQSQIDTASPQNET